jgi:hypothetical protein
MTLSEIADRLQRLSPSHRDPHYFHEEKSELVHALRRLAANDNGVDKMTATSWRGG